jgi:hypothetical protein
MRTTTTSPECQRGISAYVGRADIARRFAAFATLFACLMQLRSVQRFDLDDGGAVVAADPEAHRRGAVVDENPADVGRARQQVVDGLAVAVLSRVT